MKKIITGLLLLFICQDLWSQLPQPLKAGKKLIISFNKNIEFLGFAYFIGFEGTNSETKIVEVEGKKMLEKDWQNYGFHFYQKYKSYANSKHMATALAVAQDLWLGDIIPLLLQVDDFPNAGLNAKTNEKSVLAFSSKKNPEEAVRNAKIFLNACNEFYKEVRFDEYLSASSKYYQSAIQQIKTSLPSAGFIAVAERFYRKKFNSYSLIPSLTIPKGMGFGPRLTDSSVTNVFNVFGALDKQFFLNTDKPDMGFGRKDKLRELSIHEFGHSFVNPEIYKLPDEAFKTTAVLFDTLRHTMEEQGYNTWKTCIIEHFVRAGEIAIAEKMKDYTAAAKLKDEYINKRKFICIPTILKELQLYASDRKDNYLDMVKRVMKKLESMAN